MNAVGKSLTEDKFEVGWSLQGEGLSDTLEIGKKLSMQLGILQWLTCGVAYLNDNERIRSYILGNDPFNTFDKLGTSLQDYFHKLSDG